MKRPDIKELINRLREQHYWGKILVEAADALEHLDNCLFGLDSVAQALSRHLKRQDKMVDELRARIAELENKVTFEAAANFATAKLNANLLKRIAELEAALKPFADIEPYIDSRDLQPVYAFTERMSKAARAALKGEK